MKPLVILYCLILYVISCSVLAIEWTGTTLNGKNCDGNSQAFGPFDYKEVLASKNTPLWETARLWEINKIHYGKGLSTLSKSGVTKTSIKHIWKEFDYTLRAFPNHAQALYSMINIELSRIRLNQSQQIPSLTTPPECYLLRSISFRPKQTDSYLLFAIYAHKLKRYDLAKFYYLQALQINPKNPEINYNYGLLLVDINNLPEAKKFAKIAYDAGYPLMGLKNKIDTLSKAN